MSALLSPTPYAPRDDALFLTEMNELSRWHLDGCEEYRRVWPRWSDASSVESLPYLHVNVFKHTCFRTRHPGLEHGRVLVSSSTTSDVPSEILLDRQSNLLQSASIEAIVKEVLGEERRPLLVLDAAGSLRCGDEVSARVAGAMSLNSLATELRFVLEQPGDPESIHWDEVREVAKENDFFRVFGLTWLLWESWGKKQAAAEIRAALQGKRIDFVHSGGWKKLDRLRVHGARFDEALLDGLSADSQVVDFFGLVEQVGMFFPLCKHGFHHVPRWGCVLARDPWTLLPVKEEAGQLQFMNPLAWGSPYQSVLTEDLGQVLDGDCACGRGGQRFEFLGRVPEAQVRGCANV